MGAAAAWRCRPEHGATTAFGASRECANLIQRTELSYRTAPVAHREDCPFHHALIGAAPPASTTPHPQRLSSYPHGERIPCRALRQPSKGCKLRLLGYEANRCRLVVGPKSREQNDNSRENKMTTQERPPNDVSDMVRHWLSTPENGYLGSGYGGKTIVDKATAGPCVEPAKSDVLAKLRQDIPYLDVLNPSVSWAMGNCSVIFNVSAGNYSDSFTL